MVKKFVTYPHQIVFRLVGKRHTRPDSGMHEENAVEGKIRAQAADKVQVRDRQSGAELCGQPKLVLDVRIERGHDAVGCKRLASAKRSPRLQDRGIFDERSDERLVVASDENCVALLFNLKETVEDASGIRSSIDIVAEKNPDMTGRASFFSDVRRIRINRVEDPVAHGCRRRRRSANFLRY